MSQENVEVVHRMFEATNRGDWEGALAGLADDVQMVVAFGPSPETLSGRAAVTRWADGWFGTFQDDYRFDIEETIETSNAVVVVATHHGRGKSSGVEVEARTPQAFWVRDGKIVRIELHDTRANALAAVGLSE